MSNLRGSMCLLHPCYLANFMDLTCKFEPFLQKIRKPRKRDRWVRRRSSMEVFPADIVAEILSRLPVKLLLRFRSVSKIWCALIDSDHFIKLHLHRSIDTRNDLKLLIKGDRLIRSRRIDSVSLNLLDVAEKPDCPLWPDGDYLLALSSSNGLVMLWTSGDTVVIWNPSTHNCKKLPPFKPKFKGSLSHCVRFGYDSVNDDYKVFKLDQFKYPHGFKSDIQVYSLKSNTWRTINYFPYYLCIKGCDSVLAHGSLYLFVAINYEEKHPDLSLAAFDLATEETRLVPLPEFGADGRVCMDLVALEGCLCVVAYQYPSDLQFLGVWVMKDYGAEESWNKLLSASQLSAIGSFCILFPLAYSKNGREVLLQLDYREFIWFDLEHNAVRKIKVHGLPKHFDVEVLVQSLVPLGSGGNTKSDKQRMRDKKKISQRRLNEKFGKLKSMACHVILKPRFLCKALYR